MDAYQQVANTLQELGITFEDFYKLCQTGCSTIIDVREVAEFQPSSHRKCPKLPAEHFRRYL